MRAISSFSFDDGISTRSCSALLALRMRVSMSATGSVSISFLLPGALRHARDHALMGELPHAVAAQRHARADRHPLADLELRDRLLRAAHLRALARNDRELVDRGVEYLRLGLRLADAHVERDLGDARHLHDRLQAEL